MDERAEELLAFWLGPLAADGLAADAHPVRWSTADAGWDAELRRRFGGLHEQARAGCLERWAERARGRLALVILLDQLSRNLDRGRAATFSADAYALALARAALDVIVRFGRFPHRNATLGRTSTAEGQAVLEREGGF